MIYILAFVHKFSLLIIVNSYNKSQRDALFLKFIFDKELYMLRTDLLSIIRSLSTVYTEIIVCRASYVDCLLARSGWNTKKRVKGRFLELFNTAAILAYRILTPNKFPHSSPEAPRLIQMRETSTTEGGNYYQ